MERGILKIADIPEDYELNEKLQIQIKSHKEKKAHVVALLLKHGARNIRNKKLETPLHISVLKQDQTSFCLLAVNAEVVSMGDGNGDTPLHIALQQLKDNISVVSQHNERHDKLVAELDETKKAFEEQQLFEIKSARHYTSSFATINRSFGRPQITLEQLEKKFEDH